ncbi:hypothetical protein [Carboxylicivirga sp. N1Y90]|uniref:hypothetical protein n=1 Tax=Carboxylicivirga fragile TaxID=3417571 RepID=UPI003D355E54|nr:hypothetical protein [Marinilabiliaceae bacterium N1Y90]
MKDDINNKKMIMKKIAIYLSILFVIGLSLGGNANASGHDIITEVDDNSQGGGGDCAISVTINGDLAVALHAKERFLARGCKKACNHTCSVIRSDYNL